MLVDPSGDLVIKPCTPAELAFYEETFAHHVDFAALMPTFMGTLQLGRTEQLQQTLDVAQTATHPLAIALPSFDNDAATTTSGANDSSIPLSSRGKKLDTELAIVLENIAAGFKRPNILDVKLGRRLWADDAPAAKKQKFDTICAQTTSGSLGFRVAGMKVWKPEGYRVYDKWYGRARTDNNVQEAFEELFDLAGDENIDGSTQAILDGVVDAAQEIERTVRSQESRMYSASLLLVYEGDAEARQEALRATIERPKRRDTLGEADTEGAQDVEDDDEDDDEPDVKIFDIRVIDFAHAAWTPGHGPDENMLVGIRNVSKILQNIAAKRRNAATR